MSVKPKKHLGQHFLTDESISQRIAQALTHHKNYDSALEIGPGTGALTKWLLKDKRFETIVIEKDVESVHYLNQHYGELDGRILDADFLKFDLHEHFDSPVAVIGNFPYNISSQILFRVYEHRDWVPEVVGMFQKEVAERIASPPGSKKYGILSVLLQAFYDLEYLFTVDATAFDPPPKVQSGVIRLTRNNVKELPVDHKLFKQVIKMSFNMRRKTLRNGTKALWKEKGIATTSPLFELRPEQLSVDQFVELTQILFPENK